MTVGDTIHIPSDTREPKFLRNSGNERFCTVLPVFEVQQEDPNPTAPTTPMWIKKPTHPVMVKHKLYKQGNHYTDSRVQTVTTKMADPTDHMVEHNNPWWHMYRHASWWCHLVEGANYTQQ